jgi:hypothetical protein
MKNERLVARRSLARQNFDGKCIARDERTHGIPNLYFTLRVSSLLIYVDSVTILRSAA